MRVLFCDCCGDLVKAVYPCRFVFHDGLTYDFKVCPDCMENGTLEIDLKRKRLVAQLLLVLQRPARSPVEGKTKYKKNNAPY